MTEMNCDILIVGGGVAGLTAALAASKNELDIILIEKESEIGLKIKGECIKNESPIFTKIFEKGLSRKVIVNEIMERRIYSPSSLKFINSKHTDHYISIDYRLLMIELFKELSKFNCKLFLNTEFVEAIKEDKNVVGGICKKDQKKVKITAKYLIAADGAKTKFVDLLENAPEREIYPALKLNYENLQVPNQHRMELYLMTDPHGACWMFPKSKTSGECGIVVWTHDLPKKFDIIQLWKKKSENNKVIREIIKNAKPYYVSKDFLNFGGPLKQCFGKGFVLIGDSGGHVGAISSAGIVSSITTGYDIAEFISKALKIEGNITNSMVQEFFKKYKKTTIQKYLKKEQKLGILFRNILFQTFKTEEVIDKNWHKLEKLYSVRNY